MGLAFLLNRVVTKACGTTLILGKAWGRIHIMGGWELMAPDGHLLASRYPSSRRGINQKDLLELFRETGDDGTEPTPPEPRSSLCDIVGQKITHWEVFPPYSIVLWFANKMSLRLIADQGGFESFTISTPRHCIVV